MKCFSCNSQLLTNVSYCPNCGIAVKCKKCDHIQTVKGNFCTECGNALNSTNNTTSSVQKSQNTVKYKEGKNSKYLRASFTNEVGNSFSESLAFLIGNKTKFNESKSSSIFQNSNIYDAKIESESPNLSPPKQLTIGFSHSNIESEHPSTNDIFREKPDGQLILVENRLKATGKLDYGKRLTYLYILHSEINKKICSKDSILSFIGSCPGSLLDSHYREWLNKNDDIYTSDTEVFLRPSGKPIALQYLNDISSNNNEDGWLPSDTGSKSNKRQPTKPKDEQSSSKNPSKKLVRNYNLLDFNLSEEQREAFREFYKQKQPNGQNDIVLILAYWLKQNLSMPDFGEDEIFSAIQIIGVETPKALGQVFINIKNTSRIQSIKKGRYQLTHVGDDYVKFKLPLVKR